MDIHIETLGKQLLSFFTTLYYSKYPAGAMANHLQLYAFVPQTRVLGPFNRFALWVQGCPFRCTGCMTPDALSIQGGQTYCIDTLVQRITTTPDIEGITLTGGEPFIQAHGIAILLAAVRQQRDLGVIVYSGYTLTQLQQRAQTHTSIAHLLHHIDLLVDGLYRATQNDGQSLRGSANQQVHCLTPRYQAVVHHHYGLAQRQAEIHLFQDNAMLVGIPGTSLLQQWQMRFRSNNHAE